jgi:hypothetical protein
MMLYLSGRLEGRGVDRPVPGHRHDGRPRRHHRTGKKEIVQQQQMTMVFLKFIYPLE